MVVPASLAQPTEAEVTDYYPYGSQRFDTGTYNSQRKYIGQYYDAAPELSYLNARYYNGTTGQFISQDPVFWWNRQNLADPQTLNSYSYASGNPIGNKDPLGLWTVKGIKTNAVSRIWNTGSGFVSSILSPKEAGYAVGQSVANSVKSVGTGQGSQVTQNLFFGTDAQQDEILGGIVGDAVAGTGFTKVLGLGGKANVNVNALSSRAKTINGILDPIAQNRRTTAVLRTSEGNVIASGGRDLSRSQLSSLMPDEIIASKAPGVHAEVKAIDFALNNDMTIFGIGTSRPICSACQEFIRNSGGTIIGPNTAIWK